MAIKSVTAESIQESVVAKAQAKAPTPPPAEDKPSDAAPKTDVDPNSGKGLRKQLESLLEEKKQLEEFAQSEYELRIRAEESAKRTQTPPPAAAPEPQDLAPDPDDVKYVGEPKKFLADRDAWNRREALREFKKEQDAAKFKAEQERATAEFTARREASLANARESHPDFDDVLKSADLRARMGQVPAPPQHITEHLMESDHMAELLYHFASNPEDAKKIFELPAKRAALALGRLETRFEKKQAQPADKAKEPVIPTTVSKAPAPIPNLSGGEGVVITSAAEATSFAEYKRLRMLEMKGKRGRR